MFWWSCRSQKRKESSHEPGARDSEERKVPEHFSINYINSMTEQHKHNGAKKMKDKIKEILVLLLISAVWALLLLLLIQLTGQTNHY
jgi:hypothetical protein